MEEQQEYFPITSLSRGDIVEKFGEEIAFSITDDEMRFIVKRMVFVYLEELYWVSLEEAVKEILENRNEK